MKVQLPPHQDPLGEALHFLRLSGTFYCRSEFIAPWSLELPAFEDSVMLHILISGDCWLQVAGQPDLRLQAGDLVLLPHAAGHNLTSDVQLPRSKLFDIPREQVSERYENLVLGGAPASVGDERTLALCGVFQFDHPTARQLLKHLPACIVSKTWKSTDAEWIHSTLRFLADEATNLRPGGETIITRLADILVIQAIRSWILRDPAAHSGWLGALQDHQIGRVLASIHRDPAQPWTVATLAAEAAMSRSAFAAKFTSLVGEPALQYLTRWRMHLALSRLRETDEPVGVVARQLGYESEAAFSRTFKRIIGVPPGKSRKAGAGA